MARDTKHRPDDQTVHYVSDRKKRSKQRPTRAIQPPLTPMIDVTFLLLVFFLLTCQFRVAEGQILAKLPDISGPDVAPALKTKPIDIKLVAVGESGARWEVSGGGGDAHSGMELRGILVRLRAEYADDNLPAVLIKPNRNVRWEHTVEAYNQAVIAEFKKIAFAEATS